MRGRRKTVKISEAEWHIMKALWDGCSRKDGGMTLGEIVSVLKEPTGWSSTTIRTLIIRLSEKDAVEIDRSAGIYRYTPKASRSECISAEVEAFVKRVFDDSTFDLMALLTREGTLTADEKGALVEMLQENAV